MASGAREAISGSVTKDQNVKDVPTAERAKRQRIKRLKLLTIIAFVSLAMLTLAKPVATRIKALLFDSQIEENAAIMLKEGKATFRSDTFGDEAFWGGQLRLHQA